MSQLTYKLTLEQTSLQYQNKILYQEIYKHQQRIQQLQNLINNNKQKIYDLCGTHDWVIDYIDYDSINYICANKCGATKH